MYLIFWVLIDINTSLLLFLSAAFMYPRGMQSEDTKTATTFLNSGCIIGRVGQVREMLRYAKRYALSIRDDQQIFVRYMLENPHIVGLDVQHKLFLTMHKESSTISNFNLEPDLSFTYRNQSIGLVHFNNKKSNGLYQLFVNQIMTFKSAFFDGEDGPLLLECIRHIAKEDFTAAKSLLSMKARERNRTSHNGYNIMGDYLASKLPTAHITNF